MIDSLSIEYIEPIADDQIRSGGIKDYGKFNEGYCFRINARIPTVKYVQTLEDLTPKESKNGVWIICLDTDSAKNSLMSILIRLKLKNQHSKNIYLEYEKGKKIGKKLEETKKVGSVYEGGVNKNDCTMIILLNWTCCTLACGGGKSYLQLMMIPAKEGGKDCENHDLIRTRECNMQPCPSANSIKAITEGNKSSTSILQRATVKMMSISSRPLRYDKCHLKEGDALMEKNDETTKDFETKPMIPVRIVMTEKTFAAYLDDNLSSKILDYSLNQTVIIKRPDGKCFVIQNNIRNNRFCILDSAKGDFVEEWYYDYNLFKYQCRTKRARSSLILTEDQKLEDEYKKKIESVRIDMVEEKANIIKKRVETSEKRKLVSKVDNVRKISITAIEKEHRLEDLLEKEEESREEEENILLSKQIETEKKKEECLMKAIKEKEIENQYNIAKVNAEHAIEKITEETKRQITIQRENIARKIIEMRNKQKRKKAQLKSEILTIRTQIAKKLQTISRSGDKTVCIKAMKDDNEKDKYCSTHFADNYIKFSDCNNKESFCYVCCESEYGDLHIYERDLCYTACDEVTKRMKNKLLIK